MYIDGLVQERRNSIANTLELRLSCTEPTTCNRGNGDDLPRTLTLYGHWVMATMTLIQYTDVVLPVW